MWRKAQAHLVDRGFTPAAANAALIIGITIVFLIVIGVCSTVANRFDTSVTTNDLEQTPGSGEIYVNADDRPTIIVSPENPGYPEVFHMLGGDGSHQVSDSRWLQVMDALGWGTSTPEEEATLDTEQARWKEQWVHRDNVSAFVEKMTSINADRVIDQTELEQICFLRAQWKVQLTAARDYVQQYRRDDPDTVEKNPGLGDLQEQAELGLETVELVDSACP